MIERTVAELTGTPLSCTRVREPTGCPALIYRLTSVRSSCCWRSLSARLFILSSSSRLAGTRIATDSSTAQSGLRAMLAARARDMRHMSP